MTCSAVMTDERQCWGWEGGGGGGLQRSLQRLPQPTHTWAGVVCASVLLALPANSRQARSSARLMLGAAAEHAAPVLHREHARLQRVGDPGSNRAGAVAGTFNMLSMQRAASERGWPGQDEHTRPAQGCADACKAREQR